MGQESKKKGKDLGDRLNDLRGQDLTKVEQKHLTSSEALSPEWQEFLPELVDFTDIRIALKTVEGFFKALKAVVDSLRPFVAILKILEGLLSALIEQILLSLIEVAEKLIEDIKNTGVYFCEYFTISWIGDEEFLKPANDGLPQYFKEFMESSSIEFIDSKKLDASGQPDNFEAAFLQFMCNPKKTKDDWESYTKDWILDPGLEYIVLSSGEIAKKLNILFLKHMMNLLKRL